jgi:succinylarginine dihydrolase
VNGQRELFFPGLVGVGHFERFAGPRQVQKSYQSYMSEPPAPAAAAMSHNPAAPVLAPLHAFGLSNDVQNNVLAVDEATILHPVGRAIALYNLESRKMAFVRRLGIAQAVLPPHERPSLQTLRALGFQGRDEEVLASAARHDGGHLLRLASSASAMWSANAATVTPSTDTQDGRCHFTPANLTTMFHRAIEARERTAIFRAIFANGARFVVHDPLPGGAHFSDEGAANHTRLHSGANAVHLFAWGKRSWGAMPGPTRLLVSEGRFLPEAGFEAWFD